MKNRHIERMRSTMRVFHRKNPWKLDDGLFIPHVYPSPESLSWWDDVGFIHGGRRVMVWWVHPRMKYADAIEQRAAEIAGPPPIASLAEQRMLDRPARFKRNIGSKQHDGPSLSDRLIEYFDRVNEIEDRLRGEGIDHVVFPSLKISHYPWGTGMDLCGPMEIREQADIRELAAVAKSLIKRDIPLDQAFPPEGYTRADWLSEAGGRGHGATRSLWVRQQAPHHMAEVPHDQTTAHSLRLQRVSGTSTRRHPAPPVSVS